MSIFFYDHNSGRNLACSDLWNTTGNWKNYDFFYKIITKVHLLSKQRLTQFGALVDFLAKPSNCVNWRLHFKVKTLWEGHKMWKNLPPVLTKQMFLLSSVKTSGRFFQIFVAFSEKLNFKRKSLKMTRNCRRCSKLHMCTYFSHSFTFKNEKWMKSQIKKPFE